MCSSVSFRICDDLLCDTCEATCISIIALERSQKEQTAPALSTPAALDGNPEVVVNTVASEESGEPGDLQLEIPEVSEEETVSSPIKKTSPCSQKTQTCIEDCSFPSGGGGKRIRCCVCARHYHVKCLNLPKDEIKGHAWPCLEFVFYLTMSNIIVTPLTD